MKYIYKNNSRFTALFVIVIGSLIGLFSSCDGDDRFDTFQDEPFNPATPVASFDVQTDGTNVTFVNTSVNADSFEWDFGNNAEPGESTEENPTVVYTFDEFQQRVATVTLRAFSSEGVATDTEFEIAFAQAGFTAELQENPLIVEFTNTSASFVSSTWDFGDGTTSTDDSPIHEYTETGEFTVVLTIVGADGSTTSTEQLIVVEVPLDNAKFALITNTDTSDTGELRRDFDDQIAVGKMIVSVRKDASSNAKFDGFINLSGTSTSRRNALIDIRIDDAAGYSFTESGDSQNANANFPEFVTDEFVDVEISWDATNASATQGPLVSVVIGGQPVSAAFNSESQDLSAIIAGVKTVQFRVGGNSDIDESGAGFAVDNLKVYDTSSGSDVIVFEDDYESYTVGNSLDPDAVTASNGPIADAVIEADTPYRNNSFQVTVGGF